MPGDLAAVVTDLVEEEDDLAVVLAALDDEAWRWPTPAAGWSVLDQVAHLAEGEELASLALHDEAAFAEHLAGLLADLDAALAQLEARHRGAAPADVLARWEVARRSTVDALRGRRATDRILWVTGPISSASFATARLMETWAHGQDIADTLGVERAPTHRLRHVAHLGVATRGFSFRNRGLDVPPGPVRVELAAPDGSTWSWGPPGAPDQVTGPALDFCLVVTQRRHVDDTGLVAVGADASHWLRIAQAFAGPPTDGRPARR